MFGWGLEADLALHGFLLSGITFQPLWKPHISSSDSSTSKNSDFYPRFSWLTWHCLGPGLRHKDVNMRNSVNGVPFQVLVSLISAWLWSHHFQSFRSLLSVAFLKVFCPEFIVVSCQGDHLLPGILSLLEVALSDYIKFKFFFRWLKVPINRMKRWTVSWENRFARTHGKIKS